MLAAKKVLHRSLVEAGVSETRASCLARLAKPCVRLDTFEIDAGEEIPSGQSRIGGLPDLPPGVHWPFRKPYADAEAQIAEVSEAIERMKVANDDPEIQSLGFASSPEQIEKAANSMMAEVLLATEPRPLAFVAQIDLEALPSAGELDPDIPREGRLWFFYDAESQPWGFKPDDAEGARLIHDTTDRCDLLRVEEPERAMYFAPLRCVAQEEISPVALFGHDYPLEDFDDPDHNAYREWWYDHVDNRPGLPTGNTQIGGHPHQIQDDMQWECQLVANGVDITKLSSYKRDFIAALRDGTDDWLLLLQIPSDDRNGMCWGDEGLLFVWIRRDDLRSRRFENARVILQCH